MNKGKENVAIFYELKFTKMNMELRSWNLLAVTDSVSVQKRLVANVLYSSLFSNEIPERGFFIGDISARNQARE